MRIRDIFSTTRDIPPLDAINIFSYALGLTKEAVLVNFDREVKEQEALYIDGLIRDRKSGKPLAYIVKSKEFFSEPFLVDERVLMPRPETELLVEEALKIIESKPKPVKIVDMGTGSGAIGVILAKKAFCEVTCTDISPEALSVAKHNARALGAHNSTSFICSNLFGGIKEGKTFDVILANLPYVSRQEWDDLPVDVKGFEPRTALDGGEEGMEVYKEFAAELPRHLKESGHVLCEIGGNSQCRKMKNALESLGLTVNTKKDLSGNQRVIIGSWINS